MDPRPFISLCIPAYQRPHLLKRLLNSIERQTFRDFEIIITDDSPGTEVEEILKSFPQLPIDYSRNNPAAGTPGNWNRAMLKAKAPWLQVLHADDWLAGPGTLAIFAETCRKTSHSLIFCSSKEINVDGRELKELHPLPAKLKKLQEDPLYLVCDNMIGHPSVVLHKKDSLLQYNQSFKWVVDIDYYIRFLAKYPGFEFIDKPLINIGIDTEQVSASSYKNPFVEIPEYLQLISSLPEADRENNRYVFQALWTLIKKFRIRDWDFIREHGFQGTPIKAVDFIIARQKKIPRLVLKQTGWTHYLVNNCYRKWQSSRNKEKELS